MDHLNVAAETAQNAVNGARSDNDPYVHLVEALAALAHAHIALVDAITERSEAQ